MKVNTRSLSLYSIIIRHFYMNFGNMKIDKFSLSICFVPSPHSRILLLQASSASYKFLAFLEDLALIAVLICN